MILNQKIDMNVALAHVIKNLSDSGFDCFVSVTSLRLNSTDLTVVRKSDKLRFNLSLRQTKSLDLGLEIYIQSCIFAKLGHRSSKFDHVDGIAVYCFKNNHVKYIQTNNLNLYASKITLTNGSNFTDIATWI